MFIDSVCCPCVDDMACVPAYVHCPHCKWVLKCQVVVEALWPGPKDETLVESVSVEAVAPSLVNAAIKEDKKAQKKKAARHKTAQKKVAAQEKKIQKKKPAQKAQKKMAAAVSTSASSHGLMALRRRQRQII